MYNFPHTIFHGTIFNTFTRITHITLFLSFLSTTDPISVCGSTQITIRKNKLIRTKKLFNPSSSIHSTIPHGNINRTGTLGPVHQMTIRKQFSQTYLP